jgi:hypothetical protein
MAYPTYIRDLIYFDEGKAASIFSQLRRGLIREIQSSRESTTKSTGTLKAKSRTGRRDLVDRGRLAGRPT